MNELTTQPAIADAIFANYEAENKKQSPRNYLGGSAIGGACKRALWYDFRKAKLPEFDGRLLRLFATGHREEDRMVADLQAAGLTVHANNPKTGEQFEVKAFGGHFSGHFDGMVKGVPDAPNQWHLLETKTSNTKGFRKLEREGCEKSKPIHYAQMQVYMGLSANVWDAWELGGDAPKAALYMVHCKETDELYLERIYFDESAFFKLGAKAKEIIEATEPPERIAFTEDYYLCQWCDFKGICHGEEVPRLDCRTCIHSTPVQDGRGWICEMNGGGIGKHFGGCPHHLYIPPLLENKLGDVVDYDRSEPCDWIEYDKDGVRLKNITTPYYLAHQDAGMISGALEKGEA